MEEPHDSLDLLPARPGRWQTFKDWVKRDTRSTDWLIVLLTAGIVLTSVFQWHEIRTGSKDTHALAEAAKKQADNMSNVSDAADKIRQAAADMVVQDQRIADNAQKALEASSTQSKAALDASIASFRRDQRPYLIADVPAFVSPPAANQNIQVNLNLRNIGKTPATKVWWNLHLTPYRPTNREEFLKFLPPIFTDLEHKSEQGRKEIKDFPFEQDVAPNQPIFTTTQETVVIDDKNFPDLQAGKLALFLNGVVSYTDSFKGSYQTDFCYYFVGSDPKVWHFCDAFNAIK